MVEDEWEVEGSGPDLLHITYDPQVITAQGLLKKIEQEGFQGEIK